jgi:hypothetical protein
MLITIIAWENIPSLETAPDAAIARHNLIAALLDRTRTTNSHRKAVVRATSIQVASGESRPVIRSPKTSARSSSVTCCGCSTGPTRKRLRCAAA